MIRMLVAILALLLAGCVSDQGKQATRAKEGGNLAENTVRQQWVGRNRAELLQAFGKPQTVMDATLLGRQPTEAYVYDQGKAMGGACVHAFTMLEETGEIVDYFCR